jgi:hypothetical protein
MRPKQALEPARRGSVEHDQVGAAGGSHAQTAIEGARFVVA